MQGPVFINGKDLLHNREIPESKEMNDYMNTIRNAPRSATSNTNPTNI